MGLLRILYRDEWLVAVDKPDHLLVHRSRQARDHVVALQLARDQVGQYLHPLHRLDRATSGVLLFALDAVSANRVMTAFAEGRVEKHYRAVVRGRPLEEGVIDHPLRDPDSGLMKDSVTRWRRLATADLSALPEAPDPAVYALLEVCPQTGRTHQIRRHLKHLAHPVIGDTTYGKGLHNRFFRSAFGLHRLMLHAETLTLPHPTTGDRLTIEAAIPEEWGPLLEAFSP